MEIVLSFGPSVQPIAVALPDERPFYEVLDTLRRAVIDEGKRQIVKLNFRTQAAAQVPTHGVIAFDSTAARLNSNFEGPWFLYVRHSRPLRAWAITLEFICDIAHVSLTVDDDS